MVGCILFIIGICFGSFLNVIIDRIPRRESIFFGRSHCDSCKKKIHAYDLIPLVSFLVLHGKCRNCKKKIPKRVFLVEFLSGAFFVLSYLFLFTTWVVYPLLCAIMLIILAIAVIDMEHGIIPDELLVTLGIVSFVFVLVTQPYFILQHLFGGLISFLFFLIIFVVTRARGIGFGDVKYSFCIGFLLTIPQTIIAFYAAFLTGALISIILILLHKKKLRGETIPFGPFLSLGVLIALFLENQILMIVLPFFR